MKVSAVIPTFNSAAYVKQAIESVRSQTLGVDELIVVDDGSSDVTKAIITGFPEVIFIEQNHLGPAAARNSGIRCARSEYIAFLDSDDLWLPNKLATQLAGMSANPSAAFSFSTLSAFHDDDEGELSDRLFLPQELRDWFAAHTFQSGAATGDIYSLLLKANCLQTSSVVARRDAIMEVGLFDESMFHGEDHDLWLKLARRWSAIYFIEPLAKYRIHAEALSGVGGDRQEMFYRATIETLGKHAQAFPSLRASRALAHSYNEQTVHLLKSQRWADARRSAGNGLRIMPSLSGLFLWFEASFPSVYSRAANFIHGSRVA